MLISYITTASLDILWGVTYWVIQKTSSGVRRFLYKSPRLTHSTLECDRRLLLKLETETAQQKTELVLLNKKIQIMNDHIQQQGLIKR